MTQISPTLPGATDLPAAGADEAIQTGNLPSGSSEADTAVLDHPSDGTDPMARFSKYDLHPAVQQFAYPTTPNAGNDAHMLLAHNNPQPAAGSPTQLFGGQQVPGGSQVQLVASPPPADPARPIDLQRMEKLNQAVQRYVNNPKSKLTDEEVRNTKEAFKNATDALRARDYKAASEAFAELGFPLATHGDDADAAFVTSRILGTPLDKKGEVQLLLGSRAVRAVSDLDGFAANARMIDRMQSVDATLTPPVGVSNPPTEAQTMKFMRDFARPSTGKPPSAEDVMQAASDVTNGTIVHYSSAGAKDPVYDLNPDLHSYYRDSSGEVHEFDSLADGLAAKKAGDPPIARGEKVTEMRTRIPDEWSDIMSKGTRSGRHIGDCESKLYLQTRLLTEAGFTSIGSVDARPDDGSIGHMFGVFKAPDGSIWVTSNENFEEVQGTGPKGAVTQADLDSKIRDLTTEVWHGRDASRFTFHSAATQNQSGAHAATDSIRRASEMSMMKRSDSLIPPPKTNP